MAETDRQQQQEEQVDEIASYIRTNLVNVERTWGVGSVQHDSAKAVMREYLAMNVRKVFSHQSQSPHQHHFPSPRHPSPLGVEDETAFPRTFVLDGGGSGGGEGPTSSTHMDTHVTSDVDIDIDIDVDDGIPQPTNTETHTSTSTPTSTRTTEKTKKVRDGRTRTTENGSRKKSRNDNTNKDEENDKEVEELIAKIELGLGL